MSIEKILNKSVEIQIGEETIKVEKLALGKYAQLILMLKKLPKNVMSELQDIDPDNEEEAIQAIISLVGGSWGQVIEIISIGSGIDADRLENDTAIGLDGGVALFLAVYEVNNLSNVVKQVKNAFSPKAKA